MHAWKLRTQNMMSIAALLAGMSTVGCGGGEDPDMPVDPGETDGDDAGGGDGPVLSRSCLTDSRPDRFAYKYQCEGDIAIEVMVDGPFDGSPVSDALVLEFGPGVTGDSYESPHVMACCPEYDESAPNCEQPHERFCIVDLAEQGCKSMAPNLRDFADDAFGGPSIADAAKRAAVNKIADYVRDHQRDCIEAFVDLTGVGSIPPSCDPDDNGIDYASLLESGSWSFDPPGLVTDVQIAVVDANWAGVHPLEGVLDECSSADDNDGVLFLEIDPDPGSVTSRLVAGSGELVGPSLDGSIVQGFGELGSEASGCQPGACSTLTVLVDPVLGASLENLELHAAGAAEVGTKDFTITVDGFAVRLWDSTPAVLDEEGMTLEIPPGAAWFAVSAESGGIPGVVNATNETALVVTKTPEGWASSALTIGHEDGLGHWTLVVAPAQWQWSGGGEG
ncbi:hypothetical protein [Paraliomyxa miuraensis]|uniref:hypothetical protein n=1 Tax=Paraliomyxa miuraensis TaxID=376150 RepID=UPI00225956BC|nr:hypothetical protein [Paraliomyxa miuraensis]MCX4243613.1 hypothetical protein [Paraliomyxa miuraensis]